MTFEKKRQIAKLLVAGATAKQVSMDLGVALSSISLIKKDFIVVSLSERHPDVETEGATPVPGCD